MPAHSKKILIIAAVLIVVMIAAFGMLRNHYWISYWNPDIDPTIGSHSRSVTPPAPDH